MYSGVEKCVVCRASITFRVCIIFCVTFLFPLLVFLGRDVLDGPQEGEDDAGLGVDPNSRDEDAAAALHHVGPGENHRVCCDALLDLETEVVGLCKFLKCLDRLKFGFKCHH